MISGFIYHLISNGVVVYVGQTATQGGVFTRASTHTTNGKVFDAIESYSVHDVDVDEQETSDIMRLNPKYNKVISSSKNYIKKQSAMDKISSAIKEKSSVNKLNGNVYYDTKTIEKIIKLITDMC
jgi:uncharacterized secreted protein with C-terminal beta-propeller domain